MGSPRRSRSRTVSTLLADDDVKSRIFVSWKGDGRAFELFGLFLGSSLGFSVWDGGADEDGNGGLMGRCRDAKSDAEGASGMLSEPLVSEEDSLILLAGWLASSCAMVASRPRGAEKRKEDGMKSRKDRLPEKETRASVMDGSDSYVAKEMIRCKWYCLNTTKGWKREDRSLNRLHWPG